MDEKFSKEGGLIVVPDSSFKRLIVSPVGPANRDQDDIRNFADAAVRGLARALKAGAQRPLVVLPSGENIDQSRYPNFDLAILLESFQFLYTPLENREFNAKLSKKVSKVEAVGFTNFPSTRQQTEVYQLAEAIECGRAVARDIGGSDPERMAAPKVAEYVQALFKDSSVKVEIISDTKTIEKEFPCLGSYSTKHSLKKIV